MPQPRVAVDYRFAGFVLRPEERTLASDGRPAVLRPRTFDVLVALVERAGALVTKDELLERVWPHLVVEENNLQVHVSALRKVVGHDAIATVAGHGYRFTLPVEAAEADDVGGTRSRARPPGLPHYPTSFVGRADDLRECVELLDRSRLLTLAGAGGIGKTRMAIELAAAAGEQFADGVAFVELAPVADPQSVVDAVASALGVAQDPGRSRGDALLEHVASRRRLIVLDNCEHVVQPCADLVARMLRTDTRSKLVATTREPLHVAGEVVYQVPALAVPAAGTEPDAMSASAAVALFVDRATAIQREFAVTRENAPAIGTICRELDGMPLALELAASQLGAMSVQTIADHITERLQMLVRGDRAVPRQQTLRATLDWSYQLLAKPERALLRRLGVFAGGFALDAAEAVGAGEHVPASDVLYLLADLVDKSLVGFDARRARYQLLETVRQYALERLAEAGEAIATRDAHLRFHATLATRIVAEIRGPRQHALAARINDERDNIAAAFAHARDAADGGPAALAMVHGLLPALNNPSLDLTSRLAHAALEHPGAQMASIARCHALRETSFIDVLSGHYDRALDEAEESVRIGRGCADSTVLAEALMRLAYVDIALARVDAAREHLEEVLDLATVIGNRTLAADAHGGLGELWSLAGGDLELAQGHYRDALACGSEDPDLIATIDINLARNAVALGRWEEAAGYLRDARTQVRSWTYGSLAFNGLYIGAGIAMLREEPALASRLFGAAAANLERTGFRDMEPDRSQHEEWHRRAREAIGEAAAAESFAAGAALGADAAWAEAMAWLDALPRA